MRRLTDSPLWDARMRNQRIAAQPERDPAALVRRFGAVQAQDYRGSLWALGQRLPDADEPSVEDAIARGAIVRTWPMRGTLHYVAAEDARWMLRLLTPRVVARSRGRYRQLGLDAETFARARRVLTSALRGGRRLTRRQAQAALERGGVSPAGQRGIHILGHLAQQGLICHGPREGRQPTFVLLDEWVARHRELRGERAAATLAARYFASHGPATVHDLAWWSGLPVGEARAAIAAAGRALVSEKAGERVLWRSSAATPPSDRGEPVAALLPPWDEFVVAYRQRDGLFDLVRARADRLQYAVGLWLVLVDGRVRGAWKRHPGRSSVRVDVELWARAAAGERAAIARAAARYARFVGRELDLRIATSP
jgi:hypothetical protein